MSRLRVRLTPADRSYSEAVGELLVDHFPFVLGRHPDCDGHLLLPAVSRHHCSLFLDGQRVCVQDLHSRNGTFVNERNAQRPQVLCDRDCLRLGPLVFRVALEMAARPARVPLS
jgi:pSer/pThr/pTyr-binding forkhead associated (FHA) protein